MKPCLLGVAGLNLTPEERDVLRELQPAGFVLFARNIDSLQQSAELVEQLVSLSRHTPLILIDQEGGRVQRLGPPEWRSLPAAAELGQHFANTDKQAALQAWIQEAAHQLASIGANSCAAPVLDLYYPDASQVIGDRAYGAYPQLVSRIGRLVVDGLMARGVIPVIKHIPGHGRALIDSHYGPGLIKASLAELAASDFVPFVTNINAPVAMTAHLVYTALDPHLPFTQSPTAITWLRDELGFAGLLLSDCVHMLALSGQLQQRIAMSLEAGIDLVVDSHSTPQQWLTSYQDVAISHQAHARLTRALAVTTNTPPAYNHQLKQLLDDFRAKPAADPTA